MSSHSKCNGLSLLVVGVSATYRGLGQNNRTSRCVHFSITCIPFCWSYGHVHRVFYVGQGFLTGGKFPPWGKYWEFRGEMRAFENCCIFKTGDTKWFP